METFAQFTWHEVNDQVSSTNKNSKSLEDGNAGQRFGTEEPKESPGIDSHFSDYGLCKDDSSKDSVIIFHHQQESFLDFGFVDESRYNFVSPSLHSCLEEIAEPGEIQNGIQEVEQPTIDENLIPPAPSLVLLKSYGKRLKRLRSERIIEPTTDAPTIEVSDNGFSTEKIMRIAGEKFIQSSTKSTDVVSMLENPFGFSFLGLSDEDAKKVELAELLLASAEKVGHQLYDRARILLKLCDELSSGAGNAVERVVYYFSKALRERIDRETAKITSQGLGKQQIINIDEAIMAPTPNVLAAYQEVPFCQVAHFAGIQTVIENVTDAKKIHVIDLEIRLGVQWTGLMQALVSEFGCSLELLKITAVGTTMKKLIEDTGKRLTSFAQSISLPFSFDIVMVSDMMDPQEDLFEQDADETVVVYCEYVLRTLIALPDRLDYMMKVIRILNPSVMVVIEPEYNSTSSSFVKRFIEALFYFSAYFDCLETCLGENPNRIDLECLHFGEGIRNIVAAEGEERTIRNAKLDVWRAFFARFGMAETELSTSSFSLAKLIARKFACGNACTLEKDRNSLLIGWKGTPLASVSAWKFI